MKTILSLKIFITALLISTTSLAQTSNLKSNQMKVEYQKVKSVDFFNADSYNEIITRLENIQPDAVRRWGSMDVSQMLHHLNLAIGSGIGYYQLEDKSTFLSRGFQQFMVLNVIKKFPIGTATPSTLKVTENYIFTEEKEKLKNILQKAYNTKSNDDWSKHTLFGKMSRNDWGKLIMIHCNHHFQQFSN